MGRRIVISTLVLSYNITLDYLRNLISPHFRKRKEKWRTFANMQKKAIVAKRYNSRVFPRLIQKDNLVLRRTLKGAATSKLTPNWEGPFRVREDERLVPCTWNTTTLRKYYS
ncbi:hypothetical protein CR513_26893, partial [Mucuna pruriens]